MFRHRKFFLLAAALLASTMLSGCVAFVAGNPSASQPGGIGPVEITSTLCASDVDQSAHQGCANADVEGGDADGNSGIEAGDTPAQYQVMSGYRIPQGSTAPETFSTDSQPGGTPLTFARNASYEGELQRRGPAPAGQKWVGYVSNTFTYDSNASATAANNRITISPEFSLPQGADGGPFSGPFSYRQVVGARSVTDMLTANRPFVCGDDDASVQNETTCRDAPGTGTIPTNLDVQTRDLGITGGGSVATPKGATTGVPFTARFVGTATGGAYAVTATTTVPNGSVTTSPASFTPASDSTTPLNARVKVPSGTPTGTYAVTLTASANGQTRSATRQVEVSADRTKPKASASIVKGQSIRSLLKKGLKVRVKMSEPGRVTSELLGSSGFLARNKVLGKKTTKFSKAQTKTVRIKLSKKARSRKARRKFLAKKKIKLAVRNKARDTAGNRRTTTKKLKLKRG